MRIALAPGEDVAALVRAAVADSVVVVIPATLDPLALALARAAIGPLAIERAPGQRINAICGSTDAHAADIAAVVAFLDGATSTTGQVIEVG